MQEVVLKVTIQLDVPSDATVDTNSIAASFNDELGVDTLYVDVMDEDTGDDEEQEVSIEIASVEVLR